MEIAAYQWISLCVFACMNFTGTFVLSYDVLKIKTSLLLRFTLLFQAIESVWHYNIRLAIQQIPVYEKARNRKTAYCIFVHLSQFCQKWVKSSLTCFPCFSKSSQKWPEPFLQLPECSSKAIQVKIKINKLSQMLQLKALSVWQSLVWNSMWPHSDNSQLRLL